MYDYVAPLSRNPNFYSSDDTLTVTLQPPLIAAQREISALHLKQGKTKEKVQQQAAARAAAFTPATNWQEKVINGAKSTVMAGTEAKNSTEMHLLNSEITYHKQQFGVNLYKILEELEDTQQWLPTDREIRSIYDNCRRDIEKIKKRKVAKELEIKVLDGTVTVEEAAEQAQPTGYPSTVGAQPSLYSNNVKAAVQQEQIPYPIPTGQPQMAFSQQQQPPPHQPPAYPVPTTELNASIGSFQAPTLPPAPAASGMFAYPGSTPDMFGGGSDSSFPSQQSQPSNTLVGGFQAQQPPASAANLQQSFSTPIHDPFAALSTPQMQPVAHDPFASSGVQQPTTAAGVDPFTGAPVAGSTVTSTSAGTYQDPFAALQ